MEDQRPLSKLLAYVKINRYNLFFLGAIAILIFIIIAMIAFTINLANSKKFAQAPTAEPTQTTEQITPNSSISPSTDEGSITITTPDPTETTTIENQTQPQITSAVPFTYSSIEKFGDNWGIAVITNPDVGGGAVIIKKVDGTWEVVAGPSTYFPPDQLQSLNAPQGLIDSLSGNQTTPAP